MRDLLGTGVIYEKVDLEEYGFCVEIPKWLYSRNRD